MKTKTTILIRFSFLLIFIISSTNIFSQVYHYQTSYLQATNCNCSLLTDRSSIGSFSWFGNCSNGYCDGFGTANYYDLNGNYVGRFIGNYSMGSREGFGTRYYSDGIIRYQGRYHNNVMVNEEYYSYADNILGNLVIDSLLLGGINRHCEITQSIFSNTGALTKICYEISCSGQYDNSNFYDLTLVVKPNDTVPISFENVNDNAQLMIALKTAIWGVRFYNWFSEQYPDKNDNQR